MPVYEEKLVSPFAVRFTQEHIRTTFRDGRALESSREEITVREGEGEYDLILEAPFPNIEIIRWRPPGGDVSEDLLEEDEDNDHHWFTLDNRRLYCLQRTAASYWPKRVAAVVEILYVDSGSVRKKFDSTTAGWSVSVGNSCKGPELFRWSWRLADEVRWAPAVASREQVLKAKRKVQMDDETECVEHLQGLLGSQGGQLAAVERAQNAVRLQKPEDEEVEEELPQTGWGYIDATQTVQGPFTLAQMQRWNSLGYFQPTLQMRCDPSDRFLPFSELFPDPLVPFVNYPRRPSEDSPQLAALERALQALQTQKEQPLVQIQATSAAVRCPTPSTSEGSDESDAASGAASPRHASPRPAEETTCNAKASVLTRATFGRVREVLTGTWAGPRGETYEIAFDCEESGTCVRKDNTGTRKYTLLHDADTGIVWWGTDKTYFFDTSDCAEKLTQINWYGAGDSRKRRPRFMWQALEESNLKKKAASTTKHSYTRSDYNSHWHSNSGQWAQGWNGSWDCGVTAGYSRARQPSWVPVRH